MPLVRCCVVLRLNGAGQRVAPHGVPCEGDTFQRGPDGSHRAEGIADEIHKIVVVRGDEADGFALVLGGGDVGVRGSAVNVCVSALCGTVLPLQGVYSAGGRRYGGPQRRAHFRCAGDTGRKHRKGDAFARCATIRFLPGNAGTDMSTGICSLNSVRIRIRTSNFDSIPEPLDCGDVEHWCDAIDWFANRLRCQL